MTFIGRQYERRWPVSAPSDNALDRRIAVDANSSIGFADSVPADGYSWWYVDGVSDCGRHALTIIAFVGSVFSPYYKKSGRHSPADHCSINVCLYGRWRHVWAMTERGQLALKRSEQHFQLGPSELDWDGNRLKLSLDEWTYPFSRPVKGTVTITPDIVTGTAFDLLGNGKHMWWPVAPSSRIAVDLFEPELRWEGSGYTDRNWGSESLEDGFNDWHWLRTANRRVPRMIYDAQDKQGRHHALALRVAPDGSIDTFEPPPRQSLRPTLWAMGRPTRSDAGTRGRVLRTLEDTPFYTRSLIETTLEGQRCHAVHESLSLTRYASPWVQHLLPYKMPRRTEPFVDGLKMPESWTGSPAEI